jgi:hypothetical protein
MKMGKEGGLQWDLVWVAVGFANAAAAGFVLTLGHDYVLMRRNRGVLYMSEVDLHASDEIQDRLRLTFLDYFMAVMRS